MVDEVVVYDTVAPRDEDAKFVRESLAQETIDVVTFFSPSSVKHLLATVEREMFSSCVIAAIGSSTAEAIEECGFKAGIVAPKPTAVDLADAIARYYSMTQDTP
jgi:uroporphyrinogen-III synthase